MKIVMKIIGETIGETIFDVSNHVGDIGNEITMKSLFFGINKMQC